MQFITVWWNNMKKVEMVRKIESWLKKNKLTAMVRIYFNNKSLSESQLPGQNFGNSTIVVYFSQRRFLIFKAAILKIS